MTKTRNQRYRLLLNGGIDGSTSLLYKFAEDKSLIARIGPTLSITRTTNSASYFNSGGLMKYAGAGEARFDHHPRTGESVGLLVEPQRTNRCLQNTNLGTTWTKNADATINLNQAVAPDGGVSMDEIVDAGGGGERTNVHAIQAITLPSAGTYSASAYVTHGGGSSDWIAIQTRLYDEAGSSYCYFDLANGVAGTPAGCDNVGMEYLGNNRYRCWISFSTTTDLIGELRLWVGVGDADSTIPASDGTYNHYFWGMQVELGDTPSSMIPTTTAVKSRNSDYVITNDVSWFNAAACAVYTEAASMWDCVATSQIVALTDGSNTDRIVPYTDVTRFARLHVSSSGGAGVSLTSASSSKYTARNFVKSAGSLRANDVEFYVNGERTGTGDQSYAIPEGISEMTVGVAAGGTTEPWLGHIKEIRWYNEYKERDYLDSITI